MSQKPGITLSRQYSLSFVTGSITVNQLLFYLFGFSCFASVELATYLFIWLNPNQSKRRFTIQFYYP